MSFPRGLVLLVLATFAGILAPALHAQTPPSLGAEGVVAGEVRVSPSLGVVRGSGVPYIRATAALHVSPWLSLGGEAAIPLGEVRTTAGSSPDRSELRLRFGGVRLAMSRPGLGEGDPWAVSLLLGTGTARVFSSLLDTDLGSDNFLVVEPSLERRLTDLGPLQIGASAGYRIPLGADPLPGVRPAQLRGASFTLSAALRKDP